MSNVHVEHLLSEYLEGTLTRPQVEKTKSHLVFCNPCRQAHRDFKKNQETLSHLPPVVMPDGVEKRILDYLKESPPSVEGISNIQPQPLPKKPLIFMGAMVGTIAVFIFIRNIIPTRPASDMVSSPIETVPEVQVPVVEEIAKVETPPLPPIEPPKKPVVAAPVPAAPIPVVETVPPVAVVTLNLKGDSSGIEDAKELVLKNERGWKNIWKNHIRNIVPPPPVPAVDFNSNDVIAVFLGTRSSGGHSVIIGDIEETTWEGSPARIVHYKTTEPGPGMMNTMALTQPFHIVTAPKHTGRTFFRKNR